MKLLIEIPKEEYERFKKNQKKEYSESMLDVNIIANGTPLDKIKTEISNIPLTDTDGKNGHWYREPQAIINNVLQIIDQYRKGE